jgi:hypothetical protein
MIQYLLRVLRAMAVSSLGVGGGICLFVMIVVLTTKSEPNAFIYGLRVGLLLGGTFAVFFAGSAFTAGFECPHIF